MQFHDDPVLMQAVARAAANNWKPAKIKQRWGITQRQWEKLQQLPEFLDLMEQALTEIKEEHEEWSAVLQPAAYRAVYKALQDEDAVTARWYLDREVFDRSESVGEVGERVRELSDVAKSLINERAPVLEAVYREEHKRDIEFSPHLLPEEVAK